ncbi:UNVERIFIED_ORG: prepilin-type N-terminal cleavage/methylation domain-containing protein [Stenotrophomonas maltophilia]|nr:prepilin-type N-terminal cleavage/methylation domain-containing protein [Stenotrophomonas maltophilia]
MKRQAGFSLIELMVVIAVIAILSTISLIAYRDYTIRARVSEGIALTAPFRIAVEENVVENGDLDVRACADLPSLPGPTENVASLACRGEGVLSMKTTEVAGDISLDFRPSVNDAGMLVWLCELKVGSSRQVPSVCRTP